MITKREAEIVEQIVCRLSEPEYWGLVGWLGNGCEGSCMTVFRVGRGVIASQKIRAPHFPLP
jgi:hypothetical protein